MNLLTKDMPTSVKALPEGEGRVTALVSTYKVDKEGDRILPGAFESSIMRLHQLGGSLPILTAHDWADPQAIVGYAKAEDIAETPAGLVITFQLDLESPAGQAVWKAIKNGSLREFSVGFRGLPGATRKAHDGAYEISDLDLVEVSVCHRGVNPETRVLATKADMPEVPEAEETTPEAELLERLKALDGELGEAEAPAAWDYPVKAADVLAEMWPLYEELKDTTEAHPLDAYTKSADPALAAVATDAYLEGRDPEVAVKAYQAEAEATRAKAQADQLAADNLHAAAQASALAVRRGEAVPVVVDGRMRPVSPTLTAQREAEERRAIEAADRARAERARDAEKIKAVDKARRAHTTGESILGQPRRPR